MQRDGIAQNAEHAGLERLTSDSLVENRKVYRNGENAAPRKTSD
jgi:hypothetical protein